MSKFELSLVSIIVSWRTGMGWRLDFANARGIFSPDPLEQQGYADMLGLAAARR